jgi:hypothetical protein
MTKTDNEIDAMSDGEFYHYMLHKDHCEWARQANRKLILGLSPEAEESLATYFASAMCAVIDRPDADYIEARLDAEKAEDLANASRNAPEAPPSGKLDPAAISDRANQERLLEPFLGPAEGSS